MIKDWLPLIIKTETNRRDSHWSKRHRRRKAQRKTVSMTFKGRCRKIHPDQKVEVTLIRCGPCLLDNVNLGDALKSVIDGVADALGRDDADKTITWILDQVKDAQYGVRIQIKEKKNA